MGQVIQMKPGKINIDEMKKKLNKKAGLEVAHSLGNGNDPSSVVDWIPTGSRWLDLSYLSKEWQEYQSEK